MKQPEKPADQNAELQKKEYRKPELQPYGNVAELTQNVTNTMTSDNPTMKT